jgi:integrase
MSETHPTTPAALGKPAKPRPDFPLFPHATKRWAKKIRGKLHYFGPWEDPEGALRKYEAQKDALHAGKKPREDPEALTLVGLCNLFLQAKRALVDSGELTERTWEEYKAVKDLLVAQFGKLRRVDDVGPDDFAALRKKMAKKWGPVRLGNVIQRVRCVFKFAADEVLIDRPVCYGQGFKRPSKKTLRLERARKGPKMFESDEIRAMVHGALVVGQQGPDLVRAGPQLRAMILLGINAGFGNADVGTLPLSSLDLEGGWVNYYRPKTGISRRCPLWPETVAALREALARRPAPKDEADASLVFLTKYGGRWFTGTTRNPLSAEMRKLLDALGVNGRRNFYALRHTHETVGGEAKDQVAVDAIMGHVREDMASVYRERISDARLRAVVEHVRAWLFGEKGGVRQDGAQCGQEAGQATRAG